MNSKPTANVVENLIGQFNDTDGMHRQKAREQLVAMAPGDPLVTRALVYELNDPRRIVRWEAAKALIAIADPVAAPALVQHLLDPDEDIRWLAAEGVAELGDCGFLATLNAAIRHARDPEFCHAAHHAFKVFGKHGMHVDLLGPLIEASEHSEPGVALPVAAFKALEAIKLPRASKS